MEIFFTMLLISLSVGICIMLFLIFLLGNMPIDLIMYIVGYLTLLTFLVRLDDFLIVVRVLVEYLELEKAETKNTIRAYIEYLKIAFIVSEVNRFDVKGRK